MIRDNLEKLKNWTLKHAEARNIRHWLAGISFAESSFFPIPPDPLLMTVIAAQEKRWFYYSFLTASASVIGALFGYLVWMFFFDVFGSPLVEFYGLEE